MDVATAHGEMRNTYKVLVGKLEGKGPLERPSRRWEDNIKMDVQEIGTGFMWLGKVQQQAV
jgi:hypothetical protein